METKSRGPGRFSASYLPEQRSLALRDWMAADRTALERAYQPGDAFELPGAASSWAEPTRRGYELAMGHGYYHLRRQGLLLESECPGDRWTPDRLTAYIAESRQHMSAASLNYRLQSIRRVLSVIAPEKDWHWIMQHRDRPTKAEIRGSKKPKKAFDVKALCCQALDLMDHLSGGPLSLELRVLYRNALIVALQCVFAWRRGNLVNMKLGANLIIREEVIHLVFRDRETKNYLPIVATMPDFLKPYLFAYLQDHRPELLAGSVSDAVWIGSRHDELNYGAIAYLFSSTGKRLLGYPINCHSFRHSTATSIMTKDPRNIRMASGVLSHRGPEVVRKHYDLSGDAASRQAWEKLRRDIMRGKSLKQP